MFLAGVWLVLSLFVLDHEQTGSAFDGYWNDVLVGIALSASGAASLVEPRVDQRWNLVRPILGAWLLAAPFALGYNVGVPAPQATTSDMAVGTFILLIWFVIRKPQEK
ncbi:hypothetical protein ACIQUM_05365 [Amycolatopsis azurea]|uniref:SPW repeat domain-containing protein n=1 Tax=Amycolatopsis azurea TaxID=36819 RepID=UPI0037F45EED